MESFKELCENHYINDVSKSFIMARVESRDPKQPSKPFYSYYNAFHLNKALFQTQVYLGKNLIHRVKLLNPLTNTDIIGHVQYFRAYLRPNENQNDSLPVVDSQNAMSSGGIEIQITEHHDTSSENFRQGVLGNPIAFRSPTAKSRFSSLSTPRFLRPRESFQSTISEHVRESEISPARWTLTTPTVVQVDDDYIEIVQTSSGESPSRPLISPTPRPRMSFRSSMGASFRRTSALTSPKSPDSSKDQMNTSTNMPAISESPTTTETECHTLPKTATSITDMPDIKIMVVGDLERSKTTVPAGVITRYAVPLSPDDVRKLSDPITPSRQRVFSFANEKASIQDDMSYDEWMEKLEKEVKRADSKAHNVDSHRSVEVLSDNQGK